MRRMKDSGVEWIGEIPEEWELKKISNLYEERNTKVSDTDYRPLSVTKQGIVPQLESAAKSDNGENRKLIKVNDYVINSRSDRRGSCGISEYDGSCSLINIVLKPRGNMNNLYYNHVFKTETFADEFYKWGNGIVDDLWSTKWSNMKRIYIMNPSLDEQNRIADFLDRKCAQIDAIIAKQQSVIEKLKLYKQSMITEAVTKGLDPDVPMKDSGIEWIGVIPAHWMITKMSYLGQTSSGATPLRNKVGDYFTNADIRWIRTLDLNDGLVYDSSEKITEIALKNSNCTILPNSTVCVAMYGGGGTIGKCGLIMNSSTTNQAICSIVCNEQTFPLYLLYQLLALKKYWMKFAVGTRKDPNISQEIVANMKMVVPKYHEQKKIADYLNDTCNKINATVLKKQALIDKLTQYKKSLIYEAVTGKLEV